MPVLPYQGRTPEDVSLCCLGGSEIKKKRVTFAYSGYYEKMAIECDDPDKSLEVAQLYTVTDEVEHDDHIDYVLEGFSRKRFHSSFFRNKGETEIARISPAAHDYFVGKSIVKGVDRAIKALKYCEKKRIKFDKK
jgi:hypothetical protein